MENHPIPQDVTGFKFKLIGSITLKEFLYLLGAGILAVLTFVLPIPFLVKIPFMVIFGSIGAGLAFVPIEGRPMDKMIYNFIKTVPSENQYIYHKKGVNLANYEFFKPLQTVQTSTAQTTTASNSANTRKNLFYSQLKRSYKADDDEMAALKQVHSYFDTPSSSQPTAQPQEAHNPQAEVVKPPIDTPASAAEIASPVHRIPVQVETISQKAIHPLLQTAPTQQSSQQTETAQMVEPQAPIHITEEEVAQHTIQEIKQDQTQHTIPQAAPSLSQSGDQSFQFRQQPVAAAAVPASTSTPEQTRMTAGFPSLPDKPNVVLGIVRDPRGKVLPNILVEVLDSNGLSVRAFKTNALGQFASATQLANGDYTILFNDPQKKQEFSEVKITLTGTIFQPLEIVSIDAREKLRQELFGAKA